jgi:hypothetical protein
MQYINQVMQCISISDAVYINTNKQTKEMLCCYAAVLLCCCAAVLLLCAAT